MLFYEFVSHLIPSLVYFALIVLFNIGHFRTIDFIFLAVGGFLGTYLIDIDHIIYALITKPDHPSSQEFRKILSQKKYFQALIALVRSHLNHTELPFHNAIFIPIWALFCFFILSSSGSIFASSLVMAMYLHLLKDIWEVARREKNFSLNFLFWQIKSPISLKIKEYYVYIITVVFILESLIFLPR